MTHSDSAFFSYSREDSTFALKLAADLKAAGASVWLDKLDIAPGKRWDTAVEDALAECSHLLVILSPASATSPNVLDEVSFAIDEGKTIIPVFYRECKVPFRLRRVQHVDFRQDQDYANGVQVLLRQFVPLQGAEGSSRAMPGIASQGTASASAASDRQAVDEQARTPGEKEPFAKDVHVSEKIALKFEIDVWISYAHLDNRPLAPGQEGWVTLFRESLEMSLSMRLGTRPRIWCDPKRSGSDSFADVIAEKLPKAALMISVVTPRYLQSEWCMRELHEFCKNAEARGGLVIDNRSRVLKVIKTPVDSEAPLPKALKDTLGFRFYDLEENLYPIELSPAYGDETAKEFNLRIAKLAYEAAEMLKSLDRG